MEITVNQLKDLYSKDIEELRNIKTLNIKNITSKNNCEKVLTTYDFFLNSGVIIEIHLFINDISIISKDLLDRLKFTKIYIHFDITDKNIKYLSKLNNIIKILNIENYFYPELKICKENLTNIYQYTKYIYELGFWSIRYIYDCRSNIKLHIQIYKVIKLLKQIYNDPSSHTFSVINYEDFLVARLLKKSQNKDKELFRFYNNSLSKCNYINSKTLQDIKVTKRLQQLLNSVLKCNVVQPEYIIKLQQLLTYYTKNQNNVLFEFQQDLDNIIKVLKKHLLEIKKEVF